MLLGARRAAAHLRQGHPAGRPRALRCAPRRLRAMLMSLTLARLSLGNQVGRLFSALMVFGLATTVFGLSTSIPLSIAALVVLGAADAVSVVLRSSLVQLNTPDHMLGRVRHPAGRPGAGRARARRLRRHADVADPGAAEPGQPGRPPVFSALMVFGLATTVFGLSRCRSPRWWCGRGRRRQRGAALVAGAAEHARPHAGPRQRVNTLFVSASNQLGEVRRDGRAGRRGAGRGDRRTGHRGGGRVGVRSCARWFRPDAGSGWPGIA